MEQEFPYSFFLLMFSVLAFAGFILWNHMLRKRPPEYFISRYGPDIFGGVVPDGPLTQEECDQIQRVCIKRQFSEARAENGEG